MSLGHLLHLLPDVGSSNQLPPVYFQEKTNEVEMENYLPSQLILCGGNSSYSEGLIYIVLWVASLYVLPLGGMAHKTVDLYILYPLSLLC